MPATADAHLWIHLNILSRITCIGPLDIGGYSKLMDIKHLKMLTEIAEAGSISKVSASRGIAQSALSKHVSMLESECGAKLFHRTGRGVVLSRFGETIMPRVTSVLAEFELLKNEIRENADVPIGPVTLALQASVMQQLVDPLYQRVRAEYPNISLRLMGGFASSIEEALAHGRTDIGVFSRYGEQIPDSEEKLVTDDLFLIGREGDPAVVNPTCKFADVVLLPLVLPSAPDKFQVMLQEHAKKLNAQLNIQIELDSLTAMREIVANGSAYTILTRGAVEAEVQQGRIAVSRITDPVMTRTLVLSTGSQRAISKACGAVIDLIHELAPQFV